MLFYLDPRPLIFKNGSFNVLKRATTKVNLIQSNYNITHPEELKVSFLTFVGESFYF